MKFSDMKVAEALNDTNRGVRRTSWPENRSLHKDNQGYYLVITGTVVQKTAALTAADLVATDWETVEFGVLKATAKLVGSKLAWSEPTKY